MMRSLSETSSVSSTVSNGRSQFEKLTQTSNPKVQVIGLAYACLCKPLLPAQVFLTVSKKFWALAFICFWLIIVDIFERALSCAYALRAGQFKKSAVDFW